MSQDTYRITSPALALFVKDGAYVSQMVPKGTIVTTDGATFNGDKLVDVLWDGRAVMMFTQDLRSRAEKVE